MFQKKLFTLIFIRHDSQILLGLKKRGFGQNKWNGFGGKIEPNESVIEAAVRELREESCLTVKTTDIKHIGHLEFTFEGDSTMMDVRVFSSSIFEGTPTETEEMIPKWFDCDKIPFYDMWPDDSFWFPYMLQVDPGKACGEPLHAQHVMIDFSPRPEDTDEVQERCVDLWNIINSTSTTHLKEVNHPRIDEVIPEETSNGSTKSKEEFVINENSKAFPAIHAVKQLQAKGAVKAALETNVMKTATS
ncbi:unnamed protein product [Parnassius apollo]|uniref:(apollo) hypothetical protein n=1 Tax=Parnassius apollo TaxID=110799 RepID=A0A8S3YFA3_PARAO|nr:unnamed protein product [Parnassius apollo]